MSFEMHLGGHAASVERRLGRWRDEDAAGRLWAGDHRLWVPEPRPEIADRLGWLDLPDTMRPHLDEIAAFAAEIRSEGVREVVLLGMGGSSLAPEVFARTFGSRPGFPVLTVLDSTHPAAVAAVAGRTDPEATLFLVSSKSGTTIEPLAFLEFFWERTAGAVADPGTRFAAITDPGSHLQGLAADRSFRRVFTARPDVGGRYSALTHFGLVPAALIGADPAALLDEAAAMQASSRTGAGGFPFGAALGELALSGRDKVTFLTSPAFASFPAWVEQLIAESTGKDGAGIVPVAGEEPGEPEVYGDDRVFVGLVLDGEPDGGLDAFLDRMLIEGHPVIRINASRPEELAAEMYRAEIATAMAGSVLGIHPFDQPDVQAAKTLAKQAMAGELDAGAIPETAADGPDLAEGIDGLLAGVQRPGGYLAIQAFIEPNAASDAALQRIRHLARDRLRAATTVGFGPRFLHSTGQLHKGGPATGAFLQVIDHAAPDLEVPGAGYTFGALVAGQADGDHLALTEAGRTVVRVCLGDDPAGGLRAIEEVLRG